MNKFFHEPDNSFCMFPEQIVDLNNKSHIILMGKGKCVGCAACLVCVFGFILAFVGAAGTVAK